MDSARRNNRKASNTFVWIDVRGAVMTLVRLLSRYIYDNVQFISRYMYTYEDTIKTTWSYDTDVSVCGGNSDATDEVYEHTSVNEALRQVVFCLISNLCEMTTVSHSLTQACPIVPCAAW